VLSLIGVSVIVQTPNSARKLSRDSSFRLKIDSRFEISRVQKNSFASNTRRVPNAFEPERTPPHFAPHRTQKRRINHNRLLVANATKCAYPNAVKFLASTGKGSEHFNCDRGHSDPRHVIGTHRRAVLGSPMSR